MHLHYTTEYMLCSTFGGCHRIELEAVLARKCGISALCGCLKQTLCSVVSPLAGWSPAVHAARAREEPHCTRHTSSKAVCRMLSGSGATSVCFVLSAYDPHQLDSTTPCWPRIRPGVIGAYGRNNEMAFKSVSKIQGG